MINSSNPIYPMDAFLSKSTIPSLKPLTRKQAQESLRKEKEFLSLALESGDIFAFRYSNSVFEFDHDFYKSLICR